MKTKITSYQFIFTRCIKINIILTSVHLKPPVKSTNAYNIMSNCSKKLVTLACAKQRIYSNSKKQQIVSLYLKNVSLERNITSFKKSITLTVVGKNTFFLVATKEV